MPLEIQKVYLLIFVRKQGSDIETIYSIDSHILGVSESVTWLIQSTSILNAILKGNVIDVFSYFLKIFLCLSCLHEFLISTECSLLYCLFNVLDGETQLCLISGELLKVTTTLRFTPAVLFC